MIFRHNPHSPAKSRRHSDNSDSDFDSSDGEDIPESVVGAIEIPKSPSLPVSHRKGSTPGMKAPTHINFSSSPQSPHSMSQLHSGSAPRTSQGKASTQLGKRSKSSEPKWPQQLYRQWFGAITEGRSIQVHSMLADYPEVLNMRRVEPTPFHMALTHIASEWLGNDTTGMDGLQVAIMGYKNAYANWRLGNGPQGDQMSGMSADQMKEHVAVREVILGALIDAISPEQLDAHFFGRQNNTTLHLAAFYNDANLVERLLRQGAAVDVPNRMGFIPSKITNDKATLQWLAMYHGQVRGTRYPIYPAQPQPQQPQYYASDEHPAQAESEEMTDQVSSGTPLKSKVSQFAEAELEMETLDQLSDGDDNSDDAPVGNECEQHADEDEDDEPDDADEPDDVSVVSSSSDRTSLGLGGSRASFTKKSCDNVPLQRKVFEKRSTNSSNTTTTKSSRPISMVSVGSTGDESVQSRPRSSSNATSMLSFHTAGATTGEDTDYHSVHSQAGEMSPPPEAVEDDSEQATNRTVRIKVDPSSIDDQDIEDIFSDTDEVVQHEPSFCHTGSGLSDSERTASPEPSSSLSKRMPFAASISSTPSSIKMQSLAMALNKASIGEEAPAPISISAFPVAAQSHPPPRSTSDLEKPEIRAASPGAQSPPTDDILQRPTSPFSLRESLYEMIMGRPASNASLASRSSANSASISSSSTVTQSKDASSPPASQTYSLLPLPVHADSANDRSLDEDNSSSPSLTAVPSPSRGIGNNCNPNEPAPPSSAATTGAVDVPALSLADHNGMSDSDDSDTTSSSSGSSRFESPVPAPRPTAISLFTITEDNENEDVAGSSSGEHGGLLDSEHIVSSAIDTPTKPSRIGRREGRVTASMLNDDAAGFSSEPVFSLPTSKISVGSLTDSAAKTDTNEAEKDLTFSEEPVLSPDAPLTKDKTEQYLQTLISRNTMNRKGSMGRSKARAALAAAMRAASPALSLSNDGGVESGDDGDEEDNTGLSHASRKAPQLAGIQDSWADMGRARSPSVLGSRALERVHDPEFRPRSPASSHTREALAVSGASINGRIRANTLNTLNTLALPQQPTSPTTPARKVSPSLASLKGRGLVSLSPARLVKGNAASNSPQSPAHLLSFEFSRSRAMSTPPEARPPSSLLSAVAGASNGTANAGVASGSNSARIGRVAALSQNFERQATAAPPSISIPARVVMPSSASFRAAEKATLGLLTAPVETQRPDAGMPVTRSTSMSSSYSRSGQEQVGRHNGSEGAGRGSGDGSNQAPPPPPVEDNDPSSGGDGGSGGGDGSGGGNGHSGRADDGGDGDDGSESSPRQGPAVIERRGSEESGSTSTSRNSSISTSHGLGAFVSNDSYSALYDSNESSGKLGSSIFSSSDSKEASLRNASADPPPRTPASTAREEAEAERKRQFRELAARRKSGTLEKISNSGMVKNRKALFAASDPSTASLPAKPNIQPVHVQRARARFEQPENTKRTGSRAADHGAGFQDGRKRPVSLVVEGSSGRFFRLAGEEHAQPAAAEDGSLTSPSGDELRLEDLQKASSPAFHPPALKQVASPGGAMDPALESSTVSMMGRDRSSSGSNIGPRIGGDMLSVESRLNERMKAPALETVAEETGKPSKSSSDQSKPNSGSGDDSLHILSSFDASSTPESNDQSSTPENSNVGLLAQYNISQRKFDKRLKRMSMESGRSTLSSDQESQPYAEPIVVPPVSENEVDLGFRTISDDERAQEESSSLEPESPLSEGFQTLMPMRPRNNPQAVFGLSTVVEEEEESRNTSLSTSEAQIVPSSSVEPDADSPTKDATPTAQSVSSSLAAPAVIEMQERKHPSRPLGDLRAGLSQSSSMDFAERERVPGFPNYDLSARSSSDDALHPHRYWKDDPRLSSLDSTSSSVPTPSATGSAPLPTSSLVGDDDAFSHTQSVGSHSFDPNVVFGYTSEENSTMASRSTFDRSEVFNSGRPGSSASRFMYMHPMDGEDAEGYTGDSESRANLSRDSREQVLLSGSGAAVDSSPHKQPKRPSLSSGHSKNDDGAGREGKVPEMQQIIPAAKCESEAVPTIEEVDDDATTDEEPIDKRLFLESQDFDDYQPIGFIIQRDRDERRERRRLEKEAAKKGTALPPIQPSNAISPLLTVPNNYYEPLPPESLRWVQRKQEKLLMACTDEPRVTEHPELKRVLENASISSIRLQDEFDDTIGVPLQSAPACRGTIKRLAKRPRQSGPADLFVIPGASPTSSTEEDNADKGPHRKSFFEDLELPTSNIGSPEPDLANSSDESLDRNQGRGYGELDEAFFSPISQEFQVPDAGVPTSQRKLSFQPHIKQQARRKLVLRARVKSFSERMMEEFDELNVQVKPNVHGDVREHSAGQFAYDPPTGTVRPSMIPQYVSQLNGVPAGPFFKPPEASARSGYLYMKILSIEDLEDKTDSVYFVIRNGIDTLATTPASVGGASSSLINQEFRILTDPNVSVTMWMRFRSDAIIYSNSRDGGNPQRRRMADPGCMPPLFRKLVRRNTRSRNKWNCAGASDSVFDFTKSQQPYLPGARRSGAPKHAAGAVSGGPSVSPFPERVSSAYSGSSAGGYAADQSNGQHSTNAYDPRSLNATQAPSSVFYEPGGDMVDQHSSKGLVQAKFKEETRGVAVVHVGEMIDEVFLRGLVDSWDVENVWESRKGARLQLQLFFIPECPLFREEELPKTLSECEMAMEICSFHNRTLTSGFLSQRGGDTRFWRRRYFRLIGGFLFAYHEDTKEPRCFIDLNDATRVVDHQVERNRRAAAAATAAAVSFGNAELLRSMGMKRRHTHKRNNSDYSSRDGTSSSASGQLRSSMPVPVHEYASDSEPIDAVDISDPALQQSTMRRRSGQKQYQQPPTVQRQRGVSDVSRSTNGSGERQSSSSYTDSGIVSLHAQQGGFDSGMQHSFSIEFGEDGFIEFYAETEKEKCAWVDMISRVIGNIPKIPSWLIKLLHADVSARIDSSSASPEPSQASIDSYHKHIHQHQQMHSCSQAAQ